MKRFLNGLAIANRMFGLATKEEIRQVEENVRTSFSSAKEDMGLLSQWVNYLAAENQRLQRELDDQSHVISSLPRLTKEDVKALVDAHYSVEPVLERVREIEHRIDALGRIAPQMSAIETQQIDVFAQLKQLHSQVSELGNVRRQTVIPSSLRTPPEMGSALQEKVIKMAVRNSKDLIKESIFNLIRMHGQVSGVALRESIVHEQGLCSKSSFYRLLEEIEGTQDITVVDEGKEKRYLWGGARAKKVRHER